MGPREGALAVTLLLAVGCGKSDPLEEHPWWYLKPGRYIVDHAWGDEGAPPKSEGWRTIAWRIGSGNPMRFTIEWSDARTEGPVIARIAGRIDAGQETRLLVSVREGPADEQSLSLTCPHCGQRWQSQGGGASAGARCPECGRSFDPDSPWHRLPAREVRIRAVPPIAELDAKPSFRRDGDMLVREIDRNLVPIYGSRLDLAPLLGRGLDGAIEQAIPSDIALIFHLPPGDHGECHTTRMGNVATYVWECGNIRIEGDQSGYEIRQDGRPIPLSRYPLPVWRFAFRIEE